MPRDHALRLRRRIDELARDPRGASNVKKLTGHPGYRLRVGDWRIVYLSRTHCSNTGRTDRCDAGAYFEAGTGKGEPSIALLRKLAATLDVDLDLLVSGEPVHKNS